MGHPRCLARRDLVAGVFTVRRAFAKAGEALSKTTDSRRCVPLRRSDRGAQRAAAPRGFSAPGDGRVDIDNLPLAQMTPALKAGGCRIYDMRHAVAAWSLAAGMSIFTLSRRMARASNDRRDVRPSRASAEDQDPGLPDAYEGQNGGAEHHVA